MATHALQEVMDAGERDEFWALRGKAIQAYAVLEQAMASLFSSLTGNNRFVTEAILFRITSADSRNKILHSLFKEKFKDEFVTFRNSLFNNLRPIDIERNQIVHWNAAAELPQGDPTKTRVVLVHPAVTNSGPDSLRISGDDLKSFDRKCYFYAALIHNFIAAQTDYNLQSKQPARPWREVFNQPVEFPPSAGHPLFSKPYAPKHHLSVFLIVDG